MPAKTTHILPSSEGWVVRRERALARAVYSTQRQAIDAALKIVRRSPSGQIVVHGRNGSIRRPYVHGLPTVQSPPTKSKLGTRAIERAVSTAIRERLERE